MTRAAWRRWMLYGGMGLLVLGAAFIWLGSFMIGNEQHASGAFLGSVGVLVAVGGGMFLKFHIAGPEPKGLV